jgi:hypothetical protein
MTYETLKQDLQRYLTRGSTAAVDPIFIEQLPRLINLAEKRIARELKVQGLINPVTTTMVVGTSVYAKPDRWRDTVSINIGTGATNATRSPVLPRSYEYCRSYWPDESVQGTPLFYADYNDSNWLVVPTPDDTYPMEILYYELPPLLDDSVQTNWLTQEAPQVLLYGALLEATPFLKNDERIPTWEAMYDRAAQALAGEDLGKILDRAAQRTEA